MLYSLLLINYKDNGQSVMYNNKNLYLSSLHMTFPMHRPGQKQPVMMYTEMLQGKEDLALYISSLQESMAGMYYCSASYANTELLETGVRIETFGKCWGVEYFEGMINRMFD